MLAENASLEDRLLRALAEAEDVRRRADRDAEETRKFAVAEFARELLPVIDNLQRVLDAKMPAESQVSDALVEAVATTLRLFLQMLERFGIKKIAALGERFDPALYEALMESADQSRRPGTVTQVLEEGFTIHGRLLRPARVVVARQVRSDGEGVPVELDATRLERHIGNSDIPVVVDFWAPWCGPCRGMAPIFAQAAKTIEPRARFAKVNVDENPEAARRYGVQRIPALLAFREGKVAARQAGLTDANTLRGWVERLVV